MIFVIDSTDIDRLGTAAEELAAMLNEEELRDAALLVFANKQDQPGAKGAGDISEALRLGELKDRNWSIVACSAIDGRGISEGMDWLAVSQAQSVLPSNTDAVAANCSNRLVKKRGHLGHNYLRKGFPCPLTCGSSVQRASTASRTVSEACLSKQSFLHYSPRPLSLQYWRGTKIICIAACHA